MLRNSTIKQPMGLCVDCPAEKGIQAVIGKRENMRCSYHHNKFKIAERPAIRFEEIDKTSIKVNKGDSIVGIANQRKPIKQKSDKLSAEERLYTSKDKPEYMESIGHVCEAKLSGCTYHATDIHHKKGRGIWLRVKKFFLGVCRNCHDIIEANPAWAIKNGYSVKRLTKD